MTGHAVRHLYLCCGAADVVAETGDARYLQALGRSLEQLHATKMYVTGGGGGALRGRGVRGRLRTAERPRVYRDVRGHRQRDVELADAQHDRRSRNTPT